MRHFIVVLLVWAAACADDGTLAPEENNQENDQFSCFAKDIASLRVCAERMQKLEISSIVFTAHIQNDNDETPVKLSGLSHITLKGDRPLDRNNPRGLRLKDEQKTPLIDMRDSSDVRLENLVLEGWLAPGSRKECRDCKPLMTAFAVKELHMEKLHAVKAPADALSVVASDDVEFRSSTVSDAGEFGLRAGYDEPQNHVRGLRVIDSTFTNVRVNALWLSVSPVSGTEDNLVENSSFENNHWYGMYDVPGQNVRFEGGAIVVGPNAASLKIAGNKIRRSYCVNSGNNRSHGIEVNTSSDVRVENNVMTKLNGFAIYANDNSQLRNFVVSNNDFRNNRSRIFNRAHNIEESGGQTENNRTR